MAQFDLPLDELRGYRPERHEPADFDAFWSRTLGEARAHSFPARFAPFDAGLVAVEVFDVTFAGFGGDPIKAWLLTPVARDAALPCIVEYLGYGRGRGHPLEWLTWVSLGYAHLVVDLRGQGGQWSAGETPDPHPAGGPQHPGFLTRGIEDPEQFYYRRLITDCAGRRDRSRRGHLRGTGQRRAPTRERDRAQEQNGPRPRPPTVALLGGTVLLLPSVTVWGMRAGWRAVRRWIIPTRQPSPSPSAPLAGSTRPPPVEGS